jgi:hypothetical protein
MSGVQEPSLALAQALNQKCKPAVVMADLCISDVEQDFTKTAEIAPILRNVFSRASEHIESLSYCWLSAELPFSAAFHIR